MRLGDVATLQRGFDLPVQARTPGSFPVIGSNGVVGFHNEAKVPGPAVVIGRSGTIGKSFYTEGAYWPLNTGLYVKDFHDNDPLFLHFFFHVFDFGKYSAGVSVPTLNRNLVHEAIVCIPPFPEQRAIAAVLSKIQAAVEVQDKIVATLKELKAATMAKLFREGLRGEPLKQTEFGEIPESWEVIELRELVKVRGGKRLPKGEPFADGPTPFPYIRVIDLKDNGVDISDLKYLTTKVRKKIKRYVITVNDVYISIAGTTGLVGVIPDSLNYANLTENAARLVIKSPPRIDRDFLMWFLSGDVGQEQISSLTMKTSQPKLALSRIETIKVPVPASRDEQATIVGAIHKHLERYLVAAHKRDILKSLFSSMLHLLMTGQVRVNNLNAEEAGK